MLDLTPWKEKSTLSRKVYETLLPLGEFKALNTENFVASDTRTVQGVRVDVKVEIHKDRLYSTTSSITIHLGGSEDPFDSFSHYVPRPQRSIIFLEEDRWNLQIHDNRGNNRSLLYYGYARDYSSLRKIEELTDKVVELLKGLPLGTECIETAYPSDFGTDIDRETTIRRSDYDSDSAFEDAAQAAHEVAMEKWSQLEEDVVVEVSQKKAGRFAEMGIPGLRVRDKTLTMSIHQLPDLTRVVKAQIEQLREQQQNPPDNEFVSVSTYRSSVTKRAKEIIEIYDRFWSEAKGVTKFWTWETPHIEW